MEKIEFKSQICTTREQSERLLKLGLKKETADMMYRTYENLPEECRYYELVPELYRPCIEGIVHIPAWSLHRLIEMLTLCPYEIYPRDNVYEDIIYDIEEAIKEGYFNKDYLENEIK